MKDLQFLSGLSILLPVTAGLIRWSVISKQYYTIIILACIGLVNELLNYFVFTHSSAVSSNIYSLIEFLLYCWQYRQWKYIFTRNSLFYLVTGSLTLLWITDDIILDKIKTYNSFFHILYPFALILIAVNQVNFLIVNERRSIMRHPVFIISIAVIIFYSYKTLSEIFYHYASKGEIQNHIFSIQTLMNVLFNILITLAILCIPRKKTFIQPLL